MANEPIKQETEAKPWPIQPVRITAKEIIPTHGQSEKYKETIPPILGYQGFLAQKEEIIFFLCPICSGTTFTQTGEHVSNGIYGIGSLSRFKATGYMCESCSVHFGDPKMFSKIKA